MSLPTEEPPFEDSPDPSTSDLPRWQQRNLSPRHGLILLAGGLGAILVLASYYDVFWHLFAILAHLGMEVVEELLDTLFELVGLTPGAAQMATAYLGAAALLALLYVLARKAIVWIRLFKETVQDYRDLYLYLLRGWLRDTRLQLRHRWDSFDWLAKTGFAAVAVLILIPLAVGISVGLGLLVSMLF